MINILTYDLETTFLQKGQKRTAQRILEIALCKADQHFQRLINPCSKYNTGEILVQNLKDMNQHPDSTLRFWTKLLVEKGSLASNLKRANTEKQAREISTLLVRSDIAKKQAEDTDYSVNQWLYALENHHDKIKVARTFLEKYEAKEKAKSPAFYDTKDSLAQALKFGNGYTWIAHNGKSFDMPIIKGNCQRLDLTCDITFRDSLYMFKKHIKSDSYSQPNLYRNAFGKGYKAHHALDDAKALFQLIEHTLKTHKDFFVVKKLPNPVKMTSDLLEIKGVGQKTLAKFKSNGIHNKKQLDEYVSTHSRDEFMQEFKDVYRYKKLARELYTAVV